MRPTAIQRISAAPAAIKMKANPARATVERAYPEEPFSAILDETLHYDIGGGSSPGFVAIKRVSVGLCSLPMQDAILGRGVFKSVPEFSFLDNSEPRAVSEIPEERTAPSARRRKH